MTQRLTSSLEKDEKGLTEEEFLLRYNPDKYPKPSVTADILVFCRDELLLIRRKNHPFIHCWALPGGFANKNEDLYDTACRELQEETSLQKSDLTLVGVFSKPGRDPRGWTVSAAYMSELSPEEKTQVRAADDAEEAGWFRCRISNGLLEVTGAADGQPVRLAFDHADIISEALRKRNR